MSSTRKTEKKGKGKKEEKKVDSEEAPATSSVALKRKAPPYTVSVGVYPLPIPDRMLAYLRWKAGDSKPPKQLQQLLLRVRRGFGKLIMRRRRKCRGIKTWENVLFCLISFVTFLYVFHSMY